MCHPEYVAGASIIEELGLLVDMYYRVIPSQIIMLYATMSSDLAHFVMSLFNNNLGSLINSLNAKCIYTYMQPIIRTGKRLVGGGGGGGEEG